eukprot:2001145-Pyramimonas_sp.AAC.1
MLGAQQHPQAAANPDFKERVAQYMPRPKVFFWTKNMRTPMDPIGSSFGGVRQRRGSYFCLARIQVPV